jgi:hypothetical protein
MNNQTININEVVFTYQDGQPLFKINESTGAIRSVDAIGGKVVFLQEEHLHKFRNGKTCVCRGRITNRPEKKAELFIPDPQSIPEPDFDPKKKKTWSPEPILKVQPSSGPIFKKSNPKTVGPNYFKNYWMNLSSPEDVRRIFIWAAKEGNLKLLKAMIKKSKKFNLLPSSRFNVLSIPILKVAMELAEENNNKTIIKYLTTL